MHGRIKFGTRGSKLALTQTQMVRERLAAAHGWNAKELEVQTEVVVIKTTGDRIQDPKLRDAGGKGIWTKELEEALLRSQIDVAVHSTKDLLANLPSGLVIGCVLPREDPRDAFISRAVSSFGELNEGALFGTSSPRRRAQVLSKRPDLDIVDFLGNVETRLQKLDKEKIDGTFLAVAGLKRLGLEQEITHIMPLDDVIPAGGQGAIGIEMRDADGTVGDLLAPINDAQSQLAVIAERAFLAELDGSCRMPIACLADVTSEAHLHLRGQVLLPDGSDYVRREMKGKLEGSAPAQASDIGRRLGEDLKANADPRYFDPTAT